MARPNTLKGLPPALPPFARKQSPKSFLYTRVLKNFLGEQAAYVYALLSTNEHLTFSRIQQVSSMRPSHLRKILVSLIQMNCCTFYPKSGPPSLQPRPKQHKPREYYYYPKEEGCLKLTYADEIIRTIRSEYPDELPATIIQNVLSVGSLTIRDFLKPLLSDKDQCFKVQKTFKLLVDDGWLEPVGKTTFLNAFDLFSATFKKTMSSFNKEHPLSKTISQTKRMHMIKEMTYEKFLRLMEGEELHSLLRHSDNPGLLKELVGAPGSSNTKDNDEDASDFDLAGLINRDLPLTFNFERFLKRLRSAHLASAAKHRVGNISAKIYALVLNHVEERSREVRSKGIILQRLLANVGQTTVGLNPHKQMETANKLSLQDQSQSLSVTVPEVYRDLQLHGSKFGITEDDLYGTIYDPANPDIGAKPEKKRPLESSGVPSSEDGVNKKIKLEDFATPSPATGNGGVDLSTSLLEMAENDVGDDDPFGLGVQTTGSASSGDPRIMTLLLQHLKLLCADAQQPFLREATPGSFYVPFTELTPVFVKCTFKQYIKQILGSSCLRIFNFVEQEHLTDVKELAKRVLMRESDIRNVLDRMQEFNMIEFQEIPKTQDRSAIRAAFALRSNYRNGLSAIRSCLTHNMGEVLESLEDMRYDNKILLDKVSRNDVKGREQELLLSSELKRLQQYYEFERQTLAKFFRLRSAIDVFEFMDGI